MRKQLKQQTISSTLPDYWLLLIVTILLGIGLVMIYSASPTVAREAFGDSFYYFKRHAIYLLLGGGGLWWGYRTPYLRLKPFALPFLIGALLLLGLLFIPGVGQTLGGANRWIQLGFLSFQPSELAKFSVIVLLATSLTNMKGRIQSFITGLLPLLTLVLGVSVLILKQPDLGTTLVILFVSVVMFFMAGARIGHLFSLLFLGSLGLVALVWSHPYQKQRVLTFLNPWVDPQGTGFHIIQSLVAIGSGGLFGLGLGNSRQKYFYLPQQFTDFIYAIIGEELGLLGCGIVLVLFVLFTVRGMRLVRRAPDPFARLLAAGIVSWISFQAFINMGVVVNLLPTTGIPLPFISFGGTSLVVMLYAVGILLNISCSLPPEHPVAIMRKKSG